PIAAPPAAPIAVPLRLRSAVVEPQPARASTLTAVSAIIVGLMARPPSSKALFARPFGRQSADQTNHSRIFHELAILLVTCGPVDEGLDSLFAGGRRGIANQTFQVL